jgi:hypothetical protein
MLKHNYIKISLIAGMICSLLILLYFFIFYFLDKSPLLQMSTYDLLIVLLCIGLAMGIYRDKWNAGKLTFREALIIGLVTNLAGTFLSTVAIYIFIAFIDTQVLSRHIADLNDVLLESKQQLNESFGRDTYVNTLKSISATTSLDVAIDIFIKKFLVCFLATGFIAAILRKN